MLVQTVFVSLKQVRQKKLVANITVASSAPITQVKVVDTKAAIAAVNKLCKSDLTRVG